MTDLEKAVDWVLDNLRSSTVKVCRERLEEAMYGPTSDNSDGRTGVPSVHEGEDAESPQPPDSTGGDSADDESVSDTPAPREGQGVGLVPKGTQDPSEGYSKLAVGGRYGVQTYRGDGVIFLLHAEAYSKPTPDGKNLVFYDEHKKFLGSVRRIR